jgi:hypothetical protein
MNVVFLPALASSLASAVTDGAFCLEGPCLFGWAWTAAALTLLSAWLVRRWPAGGDLARRLQPTSAVPVAAIVPQWVGIVPHARQAPVRPRAVLAAAGLALRAPPTDMAASSGHSPRPAARRSSPSLRPTRSPGTPSASEPSDGSGQPSPA